MGSAVETEPVRSTSKTGPSGCRCTGESGAVSSADETRPGGSVGEAVPGDSAGETEPVLVGPGPVARW